MNPGSAARHEPATATISVKAHKGGYKTLDLSIPVILHWAGRGHDAKLLGSHTENLQCKWCSDERT